MTTTFTGRQGTQTYRALTLRQALRLYRDHKMMANRAYTPTAMLRAAGEITGKRFRRGHYDEAIASLTVWIEANGSVT